MDRNTLRKPYTLMCFDSSLSLNKVSLSMIYVIPKRFELLTYSLGNCRSLQLSYGTKNLPLSQVGEGKNSLWIYRKPVLSCCPSKIIEKPARGCPPHICYK